MMLAELVLSWLIFRIVKKSRSIMIILLKICTPGFEEVLTEREPPGAHRMEPPSPTQALGVNPFPSRFINRTVP